MASTKKVRRKIRYSLVFRVVQLLIFISNRLPRWVWLKLCGVLGRVVYYFLNETRRLTVQHLTMAFSKEKSLQEIKTLSKKVFEYLGKNAGEMLRASASIKSMADLEKFLDVHGMEHYERAHEKRKGVIFLTCHMGAFDLQISVMALRGLNPNIIGTPLKDERLNKLLWNYRNKHGAIAIERGRETFRLIKILKTGGSVALLIDQDTRVKSRFVNFFDMPAATPVGATVLAMKTGAAIVPTFIYLGADGRQHMHILPEIPMMLLDNEEAALVYNTQILTSFIEQQIRNHPEQWVWMHERWKTKPGEEIA